LTPPARVVVLSVQGVNATRHRENETEKMTTATNLLIPTTGLILAGWIVNTILANLPSLPI
jgi:hypothetical protein